MKYGVYRQSGFLYGDYRYIYSIELEDANGCTKVASAARKQPAGQWKPSWRRSRPASTTSQNRHLTRN